MKLVVLIMFYSFPWLSHVGDWALRWTEGNERVQIIFVMMVFPVIMNAMQYYIIDSFIKEAADPRARARTDTERGTQRGARRRRGGEGLGGGEVRRQLRRELELRWRWGRERGGYAAAEVKAPGESRRV